MANETAPGSSPAPRFSRAQLALLTLAVTLATFMEILDTTIVNVSVPHIAGNLATSTSQGTWAISSYSLASAIAVPLTGWLAERFGQVRVFVSSIILFTLSSMLCGAADSLQTLVAFRFLQGLVSGPMVPLSQTLLLANYPPEKRGLALALWSMTVVVAPILGPVLGGYLTDNYSWPWIFYINVPVGLFVAFISWTYLRHTETATRRRPIDTIGLIFLVLGVGSLQLMLDNGNDLDWFGSNIIVTLAIIAVVMLSFFIVWELTSPNPIVDLSLFKQRNFRYGVITLSLGIFCFFACTVLLPLWLQTVKGYTATWAGLATAPSGILAFLLSPWIGKRLATADLRLISTMAFIIFAVSLFWLAAFTLDTEFDQLWLPRLLQGAGIAFFFVPVNQIILSGIGPERMAAASGVANFFRTISGSFATAIVTFTWTHRQEYHHARLVELVEANRLATQEYLGILYQMNLSPLAAYAKVNQVVNQQAYMLATSEVFWALGMIFLFLIGVVWFTRPPFFTTKGVGGGGH